MGMWTYEREQWKNGVQTVCGVDEAGAGPLMGPVYAAAVILPRELDIPGLNDSKKLTEKKREALFLRIQQQALTWSVASVSAGEIDETDILSGAGLIHPADKGIASVMGLLFVAQIFHISNTPLLSSCTRGRRRRGAPFR